MNPKTTVLTKTSVVEPILVNATSIDTLSLIVNSLDHPADYIEWTPYYYLDVNTLADIYTTEIMLQPTKGKITRRIDDKGNDTGYDHRSILYKRYQSYTKGTPITGTSFTISGTTLTGVGSLFVTNGELVIGNIIWINRQTFEIASVIDDNNATVVLNTGTGLTSTTMYIGIASGKYKNFYDNNILNDYIEVLTFGNFCFNNIIENFNFGTDFLLSNNTFGNDCIFNRLEVLSNSNSFGNQNSGNNIKYDYRYNISGDNFVSNNIEEFCFNNIIGDYFSSNNINAYFAQNNINDDFGGNIIGFSCTSNIISGEFKGNTIGNDFSNNNIGDFTQNTIGNNFKRNKSFASDFINGFQKNFILDDFTDNLLGDFMTNNIIDNNFQFNTIDNSFSNNDIAFGFQNNTIGTNFQYNTTDTNFQFQIIGPSVQYTYKLIASGKLNLITPNVNSLSAPNGAFLKMIDNTTGETDYFPLLTTGNSILLPNEVNIIDSTTSPTIVLPILPYDGQYFYIKDSGNGSALNTITIDGGIYNIDATNTYIINSPYEIVKIIWSSTYNQWYIL
jgi:hypothetical protein